jgi:putative FmdB family regulatory protein
MHYRPRAGEKLMPTYTYQCEKCHHRFEKFLTYAEFDAATVNCPKCSSGDVQRCIQRIRFARSEESRLENMIDPAKLSGIEDDPKALGRLMRQMGNELGEDTEPEFNEVVSRLEKGQSPEEIEKEVPGLGEGFDGGDDFGD